MIKYFYKNKPADSIAEIKKFKAGTWVYAEAPTETEVAVLVDRFELEAGHLVDALDEDEQPRLEREDNQTYVFVRFAYRRPKGEIDTAPLLIIFGSDYIITVSPTPLPALARFMNGRISFATTQRAKLVLLILLQVSDQYDLFISQTTRRIKGIRSRLRGQAISNQDFLDFVTIEDELNEFLGSLQPTNATLRRLLVSRQSKPVNLT
jgi:magnesium transporter